MAASDHHKIQATETCSWLLLFLSFLFFSYLLFLPQIIKNANTLHLSSQKIWSLSVSKDIFETISESTTLIERCYLHCSGVSNVNFEKDSPGSAVYVKPNWII